MARLSRAEVNRLVQLHRRGVEGAAEQLRELRNVAPRALADALGISMERLEASTDPDAIAEFVKSTASRGREDRAQRSLDEAQCLAEQIAKEAIYLQGGRVELDSFLMTRLVVDTRAHGDLVVIRDGGFVGSVALSVLRAVLRNCTGCRVDALYVDGPHLVLRYLTDSSKGSFRFILAARDPKRPKVFLRLISPRKRFFEQISAVVAC